MAATRRSRSLIAGRVLAIAGVGGIHLLALLLLIWARATPSGSDVGRLTVFSLATPPAQALPSPPRARPKPPRPAMGDQPVEILPAPPSSPSPVGEAQPCAPLGAAAADLSADAVTLAAIDQAVNEDKGAQTALDALPPGSIGLANTVSVWAAGWNELADTPLAPLAPLRTVIESTLATLPAACLEAPVTGPRLIIVTTTQRTNVLVFGSGDWSWAQLVAASPDPDATGPEAEPQPLSILESIFGGL